MTPVNTNFEREYLYFVTTTSYQRVNLFAADDIKLILAKSLNYVLVHRWIFLFAYVIMPNHIHLILETQEKQSLGDFMRDYKKYASKELLNVFKTSEFLETASLSDLPHYKVAVKAGKIWEDGFEARDIFSQNFLEQKLNYIHHNPCQPHWMLVEQPEDYAWSSAGFYQHNRPGYVAVNDIREYLVN